MFSILENQIMFGPHKEYVMFAISSHFNLGEHCITDMQVMSIEKFTLLMRHTNVNISVPWLKKMLEMVGIEPKVLKLSGSCSTAFKKEAMDLFRERSTFVRRHSQPSLKLSGSRF